VIESPCNKICVKDLDSGLCMGCYRTLKEIINWPFYNDLQKKRVIIKIESREKIFNNYNNMVKNNL
tara:strand:- start:25 stop:222 length:198 start_codon:yes stop_codon:yes gene_type:complete